MIGIPITEFFVWAFLKGVMIGLFAVFVIWGVAALVERRISKFTCSKETPHDVTSDTRCISWWKVKKTPTS